MRLEPHPFSLRQLQYAVAVANLLSFRKAAEACRVSQPSLSQQLAQLEEMIGVRIFERDRRRVLVTAAGRALIEHARRVLRDADDLVDSARGDPLAGTIRIGIIPTIAPYLLPNVSRPLRAAFPRLSIAWVEDKTTALSDTLAAGDLDGAILALEAELGDFAVAVIARDPFVLATARGHPLGEKSSAVKPSELRGADVLLLDEGHCFREQALSFCNTAKARELEFRATSLTTLAQMVSGGAGVTLLPALAVPTEAKRAGLQVRRFVKPAPHRTIALVFRRQTPLAPALKKIAEVVTQAYPRPARMR
jgi:LysR family hydrogen peroxide-inducible transcriptional activator